MAGGDALDQGRHLAFRANVRNDRQAADFIRHLVGFGGLHVRDDHGARPLSSKAAADAQKRAVENEDQIQSLVKFESGAAGVIEASRTCAGRVFGIFWEISGTEGTIYNSGERFNELQCFRMGEEKRDRGFKTIYCGSQVPQYSGFFGFDFAGGGLGYFDVRVIEIYELVHGIEGNRGCFPDFAFGARNQEIIEAMDESTRSGSWVSTRG